MEKQVLHIDCPDEKGLVYRITEVLYRHGLNIVSNQEFVDTTTDHFVMRTAFEGEETPNGVLEDLRTSLPNEADIRHAEIGDRSIVIMATKEPHCLGDLLLRYSNGEIPADVQAVISNHDNLRSLSEAFDVPFHAISHEKIDRKTHEAKVEEVLEQYQPDYIVLAKYMRIFSSDFVDRYKDKIINIHHSFLPAFIGANPYQQAFERGVKIIGATAHFVTDDLDEGPIIAQDVMPVNHSYTAEEMASAGRDVEKTVLAKAVKLLLEERIFIHNGRTIVFE
ncbi:formyltetrahydrofolate deformylase [Aliifodinibius salicampi]|uniref:Formyltetrahydrofolate deformylase n=1 Tax=Fodinibius salicampi TaxID=1920655 RepID=A0ABT3Q2I1_9BACT|nr:formyltetrahydrofolate deformylase [Fodinibius salicampi]MCW9714327.1 formyltetrahydrofolate deformylase [Fodinibius salicampi]